MGTYKLVIGESRVDGQTIRLQWELRNAATDALIEASESLFSDPSLTAAQMRQQVKNDAQNMARKWDQYVVVVPLKGEVYTITV